LAGVRGGWRGSRPPSSVAALTLGSQVWELWQRQDFQTFWDLTKRRGAGAGAGAGAGGAGADDAPIIEPVGPTPGAAAPPAPPSPLRFRPFSPPHPASEEQRTKTGG